jgi:hypothetical protein
MAFNDLLSSSFLFSIAIIIILIGGIFAYVSYRMSEQDHKISSMLGLISTMAGELQFFRSKLSKNQEEEYEQKVEQQHEQIILDQNNLITRTIEHPVLISVSDDEEDAEDEDDEDDEDDDDDEDDEDEDDDDDDDDDDEDDDKSEIEELNIDEEPFDFVKSEQNNLEEIIELEQPILNFENITENSNIKSIHLEEPIDLNFTNKHQEQSDELLISDLKTISMTDLEEPNKKQEYKKMSINKLREVVVEKGVIADASKLKKQDILKLLGDE